MELKNKDLSRLQGEYRAIIEHFHNITEGLSDEQMNWQPAPGKWSIAECIDHINATGEGYFARVSPVIKSAREKGITGNPEIKFGWFGKMLRMIGLEPPPKKNVNSPKPFKPRNTEGEKLNREKVISDFISLQDTLLKAIEDSDGLELNKVKFPNPVTNLIRVRLGDFLDFTASHQRRHLWQAGKVKELQDFPS